MTGLINKHLLLASLIVLLGLFFTTKANAASLTNASDFITTSRPSPSAPLVANQFTTTDTQVTITSLDTPAAYNSPDFIASDSAFFIINTSPYLAINPTAGAVVASESANDKPSANQQIVYLTKSIGSQLHAGTIVTAPVTATHTISFKTVTAVPASGHILINFPGPGSNIASPSATTFSFNNLASSGVQTNNVTCTSITPTAPTIDCLVNGSGVPANTQVTFEVGCTSQSAGVCTAFKPSLINPTKGATATGTADVWKVSIQTTDTTANGGSVLDSASVKIATVEAVEVQGTVEPYLTFTISAITPGTAACSDTTNAGNNVTADFVDLGSLGPGTINIEAQNLTVNTNASTGYAITATSSGHFINPASGIFLPDANTGNNGNGLTAVDTPAPAALTASTTAFGIHPCANGGTPAPTVNTGTWGSGATGGGAGAKYSNPWNTGTNGYYANISSTTTAAASSVTTVEYAGTVSQTFPSGIYFNYFTYVATATF